MSRRSTACSAPCSRPTREYRTGAGIDWLRRYWPNLTRLLRHGDRTWNVDGTGMLNGVQPSTHDIDLAGHNPFMGTLWLASLRAAEQMALLLDDADAAAAYRATFDRPPRPMIRCCSPASITCSACCPAITRTTNGGTGAWPIS
jgi:familyl 116 glycosyl hydrolase-like protein